eukprot:GEMP01016243.1.p1 GENE.GEMP01016243.1~~GEMP01016243.1.p1  ORF type:complete len:414 (-),score=90.02 GEMP01016243.1:1554-2795(-)
MDQGGDGQREEDKSSSETQGHGWTKVCHQNLCFDELSSLSTLRSRDLDETIYSQLEQNIRRKLERQNRRKFLSKRCRFNIALAQVKGEKGNEHCDVKLLREKMLENWILVEERKSSGGNEYVYQVAWDSDYFQVSILETTLSEQLLNYCENRLHEYLNRKMSVRHGVDECVHVCVCLFPGATLFENFDSSLDISFESEMKMMKRLNDIVSIIPVVSQIEKFDPARLPCIRLKLRNMLAKEVKVFDDWFGTSMSSNGSIPEEKEDLSENMNSPLIPGPDFNLFTRGLMANDACSSNEAPLRPSKVQADVISKLRSQVLTCPLVVDCTSNFSEQDSKYQLPRFDSYPPTSCDFLRMVLIEGCSLILMEKTKTLFGSIAERRTRENERKQKFEQVHHLLMSGVILVAATVSFLKRA